MWIAHGCVHSQAGLTEQKQLLSRLETETDHRLSQVVDHLGKFETDTSHSVSGLSGEVDSTRRHAERHVTSLEDRTARQLQVCLPRMRVPSLFLVGLAVSISAPHTETHCSRAWVICFSKEYS